MKLKKKNNNFLKEKEISNPSIFERRTIQANEDGMIIEKRCFAEDGLFSPKIFGELDSTVEYSCECGKYQGLLYEGIVCDSCKTEVKSVQSNIEREGWIDLDGSFLIKYIPYLFLEKIIGKDNLINVISIPTSITIDGDIDTAAIKEIQESSPECKYYHIGIQEFRKNYTEVLDYYFNLKQNKKKKKSDTDEDDETKKDDIYDFVACVDEVFTDKIFVLPAALRPAMRTSEGLKLDELNILYTNILKNAKTLKDTIHSSLPLINEITMETLQSQYFQLSEMIIENIKSKYGLIRNQICGTRVNFSARNIITPADVGVKIDEIIIPYMTFMELHKYEIINILCQIKNCSYVEAERIHYSAMLQPTTEMMSLCKKIIKENELGVLLNRNPTISYGSILYLKIAGIKEDYSDDTMSLSNTLLSLLAGDYDGDVLNLISIKDKETKEIFKQVFSPINLIIDPNSGDFNSSLCLERDQILGLNSLLI